MTYILMIIHLYLTFRLKFVPIRTLDGIKYSFKSEGNSQGIGTYKAFAAALGTTIGPGNITGVAVAISMGGSGALFWMWLSGIFAMSTKYAESYLSLKYKDDCGGTMTLLCRLNHPYLAVFWAIMCGVGGLFMGAAVPSNSLASSFSLPDWTVGAVLTLTVVITVSFGFKGIADVSSLLVPVMSVAFTLFCLCVTAKNIGVLPTALVEMFKSAFLPSSIVGGSVANVIKQGVTRGLYSNESGLGTGGVLAAESGDPNVEMSALAAMTTTFWDTVVMCAVTGVMFLCCGAKKGMPPVEIINNAFCQLPFGKVFLCVSMTVFVYATVIGWYYIAKRAVSSVFKNSILFDVFYVSFCFFGAVTKLNFVWKLADIINFCLLIPSIYVILRFSGKIALYRKDN